MSDYTHCRVCGGDGIDPAIKTEAGAVARGELTLTCEACGGTGHVESATVTALRAENERLIAEVERLRAQPMAQRIAALEEAHEGVRRELSEEWAENNRLRCQLADIMEATDE